MRPGGVGLYWKMLNDLPHEQHSTYGLLFIWYRRWYFLLTTLHTSILPCLWWGRWESSRKHPSMKPTRPWVALTHSYFAASHRRLPQVPAYFLWENWHQLRCWIVSRRKLRNLKPSWQWHNRRSLWYLSRCQSGRAHCDRIRTITVKRQTSEWQIHNLRAVHNQCIEVMGYYDAAWHPNAVGEIFWDRRYFVTQRA